MLQMNPDQYDRIKHVIGQIATQPSHRREAILDSQCGTDAEFRIQVEAFLKHFDTPAFDFESIAEGIGSLLVDRAGASDLRPQPPERIGPYRIIRQLGEGGMGLVFLGEQDHPRRQVAIKIIRPGFTTPALLRRFDHETHILGRLQHPGIAQIYSAGTFDTGFGSQPYLVMEYIEGQPLGEYLRTHHLSLTQRLELFTRICDAVQHAHQRGIIHRDLKPANILVMEDDPDHAVERAPGSEACGRQPKVLDFGIARASDPDIQVTTLAGKSGQLVGTLPYMSPEQVSGDAGDVDIRSDVYALGVVLFEMLSGRLPYDFAHHSVPEMSRVIRDVEPLRLGALNRQWRGDIETIVAKALEKDRARRYQTLSELLQDLERYLRDEPILARRAGRLYQLSKFARRNKALVGGLAAVAVTIVMGVAATGLALIRALDAEELAVGRLALAEREAAKARAVNQFLQTMLAAADPRESGHSDITMRTVLDLAADRLASSEFEDDPEVRAAVLHTLGVTYRALSAYPEAREALTEALDIRMAIHGRVHLDTAASMNELGEVYREMGDLDAAEPLCVEALELRQHLIEGDHQDLAVSLNNLALVRKYQGDLETAEQLNLDALAMRRRLWGDHHIEVVTSLNNLALTIFQLRRDFTGAEAILREIIDTLWVLYPDGHVYTSNTLDNLGTLLSSQGRYAEAEEVCRQSLEMRLAILPANHELIAEGMSNLGIILRRMDRFEEAEDLYRASLAIRLDRWGDRHPSVATTRHNLGTMLSVQGRTEEAIEELSEALDIRLEVLPPNHSFTALTANNLAIAFLALHEFDQAESLLQMALDMHLQREGAQHSLVAQCLHSLASIRRRLGDFDGAEQLFNEAIDIRVALFGRQHPSVSESLDALSSVLRDVGRAEESFEMCQEALAIRIAASGEDVPATRLVQMNLASHLIERGRADEAAEMLTHILARWRETQLPGHDNIVVSALLLGHALTEIGEAADAEPLLIEALEHRQASRPAGHWHIGEAMAVLGRCLFVQQRLDEAAQYLLEAQSIMLADAATPPHQRDRLAAWIAELPP